MVRSKLTPIFQPNDFTCGPASVKIAAKILGRKISFKTASLLCRTDHTGTSTDNLIQALRNLGFYALYLEEANLKHVQAGLRSTSSRPKAVIVSYLYDHLAPGSPDENSGHFAVVSSYSSRNGRIHLFDSYTGKKTSTAWLKFIRTWYEIGLRRRRIIKGSRKYRMIRAKTKGILILIAREKDQLPKFRTAKVHLYLPVKPHHRSSTKPRQLPNTYAKLQSHQAITRSLA